jgi:hypothetical protein
MRKALGFILFVSFVMSVAPPAWCQGMKTMDFEKGVVKFKDRVLDTQKYDFTAAKKKLIGDLYQTAYVQNFYTKYEAVVRTDKGLGWDIDPRLNACKDQREFNDIMNRYAQWNDLCRMTNRALEDLQKGVIKEYMMDKQRKGEPPFEITDVKWQPSEVSSEDIEAYKKELPRAESVLKRAVSALKGKDEDGFAKLFPEKLQLLRKAEPEKSEINKIFKSELAANWQDGMSTEIAPMFLRADLEMAARQFKKDKKIKTVVRRWNGKNAKLGAIIMEKDNDNNYVIKDWNEGSFDMQNRRRL